LALADAPIRHVAVSAIQTIDGQLFLRRYTLLASLVGFFFMSISIWTIADVFGTNTARVDFLSLAPLILVPVARAVAVQPTAVSQSEGLWGRISLYRMIGAVVGAALGLPIVLINNSIVGASIASALSEITYAIIVTIVVASRRGTTSDRTPILMARTDPLESGEDYFQAYRHMTLYSAIGWLQGLSERVLVGLWAGTGALGVYSLGTAVGRSSGDAIAASQPTVLRTDLAQNEPRSDGRIRKMLGRDIRNGLVLTVSNAIAVIALAIYVLPHFLGPDWTAALEMVPILALSAIPLAIAASSAPVQIHRGKARIAYIAPAICLIFAPLIALAAINSLVVAAWIVLLRECVLALLQSLLMGRVAPWREIAFAMLIVAAGSLAVFVAGP
jgi:O-antigen/teichoic acid export membrane protein